jgi:hypothetical protein
MKTFHPSDIRYILLISILFMTGCTGNRDAELPLPWVPQDLAEATKKINDKCPEMVDPETRLDSVLLSDKGELIYYYTLPNRESGTIDPIAFEAYLLPEIIENVRYNTHLNMHRDSSITLVFNYRDKAGNPITTFFLHPNQYQ